MSLYSEMMGSFIRTGNYPMEAHYVFPTESALKEFYSNPINATTIHKGLFRIVENGGDGNQALYWAVQSGDTLKFEKLIENLDVNNIDSQLSDLYTKLQEEIDSRKEADKAIWGTNDLSNVPEELNSLYDLSTALTNLILEVDRIHKELIDVDDSNYKSLKTELKNVVGTLSDDIISYLLELPYKSLTAVSNELNKFLNTYDELSNQINTLPELKSFLNGYKDSDTLKLVLLDLKNDILGSPTPTSDFRTLRAIEDFIRIFKADSENTDRNLLEEIDLTLVGIGLSGDGSYNSDLETYYLKDATSVMNALKILDSLVYEAISGITIKPNNTDVVDLSVRKELEGYVIGAKLNLSNVIGNDILKKEDGLYLSINSTYHNGILSLYANDKLVALHILGFSSMVENAYYDPSLESIIIIFKLLNGEELTITVPVGTLIRELVVDNDLPSKVVELTRETVIDGPDKLSADVRIYNDKNNILKKVGNALSVDGTSYSIIHNDETLNIVLENIKDSISTNSSKIDLEVQRASSEETNIKLELTTLDNKVDLKELLLLLEIHLVEDKVISEELRATQSENTLSDNIQLVKDITDNIQESIENINSDLYSRAPIDSPIFTGVPQVEVSPDENDSSLRIPSTNWVNNKVAKSEEKINLHIENKQNPHNVTAELVGSYTKLEIDSKFSKIDEVTNKCIRATEEASKVNATLNIDNNTLTVTDRNGVSTSLEVWGTTDEHISVYLSSEDGLAVVSNLDVSLVYVGTDLVYHATTDDNGICLFIVPNGIKYRIILPEILDYLTPAEEEHMASIASRSIEHRYRRIGEEVEQLYILVNQMENGVYTPIENHQVKVKIGLGTTSTYYTPTNGTLVLDIPSGLDYVVDIATKENYYIRGLKYHYELQATEKRRHIYVNFRAYESGIWIVTDQNEEVTYEDWVLLDRDPQSAQLIKIATGELSAAGGVYYLKIDDIRFRQAPAHLWTSLNVLFNSIPLNGNSLSADYYYDGYTSTRNIQQEGDTRTIGTNAADYALAQSLLIGELTLNGFMGSCGLWVTIWRNKEHIDDILEAVRPDLGDGKTYYLFSNWTVSKWTSTLYSASSAWRFTSVLNGHDKNYSYAVLVFYAPS